MRALKVPATTQSMPEINDPRTFPDPAAAPAESARLHGWPRKPGGDTRQEAAAFDAEIRQALSALLAPAHGRAAGGGLRHRAVGGHLPAPVAAAGAMCERGIGRGVDV